jgi:hypothetical protein
MASSHYPGPSGEPVPEEIAISESELLQCVTDAKRGYEEAKAQAMKLLEYSQDSGLINTEGIAAARTANRIQHAASSKYFQALRALTNFVIDKKLPGDMAGSSVQHSLGTANFRCICGEPLTFSAGSKSYTNLADLIDGPRYKSGRCPRCDRIHSVRYGRGD